MSTQTPTDLAARFEAKREAGEATYAAYRSAADEGQDQPPVFLPWAQLSSDKKRCWAAAERAPLAIARDMARADADGGANWTCAARRQGTVGGNDPADCDWPVCGCDPYADKVVAALQESGHLAPPPPAQQGSSSPLSQGETVGELERLSAAATQGEWGVEDNMRSVWVGPIRADGRKVAQVIYGVPDLTDYREACAARIRADAALIVALVNAYRSGHLVPASLATARDGGTGAGANRDRSDIDFDDLNRLFAQIPEGPWHPIRTGNSHEIRQIDTDPTNKHHWPFRLCQSIAGQRAGCDDAVFAFIAGVLNAWPAITATNSDEAYIERVLAMPEDELRKRFLVDGQSPEQAETISRQAFDLAVLKVALTQIHDQYIINRGDMTDAEAIGAIRRIAAKALGIDPAFATLSATDQAGEVRRG